MTQDEEIREKAEKTAGEADEAVSEKEQQSDVKTEPEETTESGDAAETEAEETAEEETAEAEPESTENPQEETEDSGDEDARGFFKKKKKEKKEKKDEKIAELTDMLQRQMAEFENFRRRTEKEKSTMYDMGTRDTVEKLLPVIDNFERGLAGAKEEDPFAEGMKMIYKQLMTILSDLGVTPIEAAGKEFDPNLHNAVMHVDDDTLGENVVAEELQKGYIFKDHVVRHSMVKVAN